MTPHEILRRTFGHDVFREGQEALIGRILAGQDVLGVMPTGAGKSVCYQIPALLVGGVTVVVSPLISLMKDQVEGLIQMGVRAAYINSSLTPGQSAEAMRRAALGAYQIIYVAPERLLTEAFLSLAGALTIPLLVVDEAHCVSQWGQDFRPSYRDIPRFVDALAERPAIAAFTATATARVRTDILAMLRLTAPHTLVTGFDRKNLAFHVRRPRDKTAALLAYVGTKPEASGIVYCATRKNVDEVCAALIADGYEATKYHAGLGEAERRMNQDDFLFDRKSVMVATNAFGMGIDKSNVSYVVHYNMPKNLESYYQEAGRAGRDGEPAECVLFYSGRDVKINEFLITNSVSTADLTPEERETILRNDRELLRRMTSYCFQEQCLRAYILRYFGEAAPERCENCSVCVPLPEEVPAPARRRERQRGAGVPATAHGDDALLGRLKALRASLAKEAHVPAYIIFTDATLKDMCARLPKTEAELLQVSGVGEHKMRRYGADFLALLRGQAVDAPTSPGKPAAKTPRDRAVARGHAEAYLPWTDDEEARLRQAYLAGQTVPELSRIHGRTRGAIRARLKKLGLIFDGDEDGA